MPRVGLNRTDVIAAGAALADEIGFANLALGSLAERLGVRTPSLYKHIESLADLRHGIATLALTELDQRLRDAMHGHTGRAALAAYARGFRAYVLEHPGRYAATVGEEFSGPDDPMLAAGTRLIQSIEAVLRGYGIDEADMVHAVRTLRCTFHGFASLQISDGFQWSDDADVSFDWMIRFIDLALDRVGKHHDT